MEASRVAAHLAAIPDDQDRQPLMARFWELYWGQLAFVESPEVQARMVQVCERYVSPADRSRCHADEGSMSWAAIGLAHQASKEVKSRWQR